MKIKISDHQHKSDALRRALEDAGHEIVIAYPDVLLIDFDAPIAHYPRTIERAYEDGAAVYLYSHGAMPLTCWDGIWTPSDKVSAFLAQTPGQKRVMEAYNYPYPIHVIGWHYCEQHPFKATNGKRVLFAPWHPQSTGWLIQEGKEANARIWSLLRQIRGIQLTVRFVGELEDNNLPFVTDVYYDPSNKSLVESIEAIQDSDLVVSYGTLAYLSVALGVPTVMYGQDCTPYDGYSPETCKYVKHYEWYRDIMHYPYDGDTDDVEELKDIMDLACMKEASDWRSEFIGDQFDPEKFVKLIEQLKEAENA